MFGLPYHTNSRHYYRRKIWIDEMRHAAIHVVLEGQWNHDVDGSLIKRLFACIFFEIISLDHCFFFFLVIA